MSSGTWLLSTNPRAVYNATANKSYFGAVSGNGSGRVIVTAYDHAASTFAATALTDSGFDYNDHATPSFHFRQDGRIQVFYSRHNDGSGLRWRLSTNPLDISAFGSEQIISNGGDDVTYSNPRYLSAAGRLFLFFRNNGAQRMRVSTDDGATFGAQSTIFSFGANRPYGYFVTNGSDRIDFLVVEDGPDVFQSSVYHGYAKWEAGALNWYTSNGSPLSLPINPQSCTKIYDGATTPAIWQDMVIDASGHPRVTFATFPSTTESRYFFSRWTGSAWTTPTLICSGGHPLYPAEWDYCGGVSFDGYTPNRVYVSVGASSTGPWEIQTYDTTDNGATWAKVRDVTSASGTGFTNARPIRVEGQGPFRAAYFAGTYTSFTSFSTQLRAFA